MSKPQHWPAELRRIAAARYAESIEPIEELSEYLAETRQGGKYVAWLKRRIRGEQGRP